MTLRHTLGLLAVLFTLAGEPAFAQTTSSVPAPTATTTPSALNVATAQATTSSSATLSIPPPKSPWTVLTLTPTMNWATGGTDNYGNNENFANGAIRLGGNLTQRITNRWSVVLQRSYLEYAFGEVTTYNGKPAAGGFAEDAVNNAHLGYSMGPILLTGGYQQRIRQCCPAASSAANPAGSYFFWYVQAESRFGPNSKLGRWFGISLQDAEIPHPTSPYFPNPAYAPNTGHYLANQGTRNKITYAANVTIPVDREQTLGVFVTYDNRFDYFLNAPELYIYNTLTYGFKKNFSKYVTYTAMITDLNQHKQDAPFVYPNTLNRSTLTMNWDFKVPF